VVDPQNLERFGPHRLLAWPCVFPGGFSDCLLRFSSLLAPPSFFWFFFDGIALFMPSPSPFYFLSKIVCTLPTRGPLAEFVSSQVTTSYQFLFKNNFFFFTQFPVLCSRPPFYALAEFFCQWFMGFFPPDEWTFPPTSKDSSLECVLPAAWTRPFQAKGGTRFSWS